MLALFLEHFYIASGFWCRTLYIYLCKLLLTLQEEGIVPVPTKSTASRWHQLNVYDIGEKIAAQSWAFGVCGTSASVEKIFSG